MSRASELMDSRKFVDKLVGVVELCVEEGDADIRIRIESNEEAIAEALQAVLDMAMPQGIYETKPAPYGVFMTPTAETVTLQTKPRGIKALIPVPNIAETMDAVVHAESRKIEKNFQVLKSLKPKRKRRTKAEMEAARGTRQEEITKRLKPFNVDKATDEQVAAHIDSLAAKQITPEKAIADVIESAIKPHFATRAPGPDGFKHFVVFMSRPDGSNLSSNGTKWKDALNAAGCRATKVEMTLLNAASRQFDLMVM